MTHSKIGRAVSRLAIASMMPAVLALLGPGTVLAHTPDGQPGKAEETVQPLMKQPIKLPLPQ